MKKSIATMSWICCFRNVVHDGELGPRSFGRYFSTVRNPVPFVWTATAKAILKKTARAKQTLKTVRVGTKC